MTFNFSRVPRTSEFKGKKIYRLVQAKFPLVPFFEGMGPSVADAPPAGLDDIVDEQDRAMISAVRVMNHEFPDEYDLGRLPEGCHRSGPNATYLMAPLTFRSSGHSSRFSNDAAGAVYFAESSETAICETAFHFAREMRADGIKLPTHRDYKLITCHLEACVFDFLRWDVAHEYLDPDPGIYPISQRFAAKASREGCEGIAYPSLRRAEGICFALFRPDIMSLPDVLETYRINWDGNRTGDFCRIGRGNSDV